MAELVVRGAREHNLKNLTVRLPRDALVVLTGPSGSGKSSLAFDTIYAEAERRYVESLSVYARHYLGQMPKPDVDGIDGLSPAISVRQQGVPRSPRSTVGTLTEIYDYLRLLYARAGLAHSPHTAEPMRAFTVEAVVEHALALAEEARLTIAAPMQPVAGESAQKLLARLRKDGFVRVAIDGVVHDLGEDIALANGPWPAIDVHVDRVRVKPSARARISEAVELAFRLSGGLVRLVPEGSPASLYSEHLMCVRTGERYPELTPRSFSFNSPEGACPACDGMGRVLEFDPDLVVPDPALSIRGGAIAAWGSVDGPFYAQKLLTLASVVGVDLDKPWEKLSKATVKRVLEGAPKKAEEEGAFEGVMSGLTRRAQELTRRKSGASRDVGDAVAYLEEDLMRFARDAVCSACHGSRLSALARHVTVDGRTLPSLSALSLDELRGFFEGCIREQRLPAMVDRVVRDVASRVSALVDLGLAYLSIDRAVLSLSGGEIQRIRLATQIGSGLVGVLYVLDEPSAGLHARDNERLITALHKLRDQGNTVLVVEHDEATIRAADHVVDLGEGAGVLGGRVMAEGTPRALIANPQSLTGDYLAHRRSIPVPEQRRVSARWFGLEGVTIHNLHGLSCRFPVGALSCITGVSGSGKSSLVTDTLLPAVKALLRGREGVAHATLVGAEVFDRVIDVDQRPIGRTPRSSPASYLGAFDELRELFASLPGARAAGYGPSRFSFNVKGGRCEACRGDGVMRVDMQFLPDAFVRCEACGGRRYNRETLAVRYRGHSIADVLDMSAEQALILFQAMPKLAAKLGALCDVGLSYIAIGQPATTLSGGEAQRVKLARELARRTTGRTLIMLDEPTTGLHMHDVALLLSLLSRLVDAGNTVVVVEHHLDVIKSADYVLDLGPDAGPLGGGCVASGTPEQIAIAADSHTGRYLAAHLALR